MSNEQRAMRNGRQSGVSSCRYSTREQACCYEERGAKRNIAAVTCQPHDSRFYSSRGREDWGFVDRRARSKLCSCSCSCDDALRCGFVVWSG